jgi:hypothetical protein
VVYEIVQPSDHVTMQFRELLCIKYGSPIDSYPVFYLTA